MIALKETGAGVTFSIRVQPRAKRNAIVGELGEALKIALTAPPVDSRANDACVQFLAKVFDVSRSSVTIVSGHSSRNKVICLAGISIERVRERMTLK